MSGVIFVVLIYLIHISVFVRLSGAISILLFFIFIFSVNSVLLLQIAAIPSCPLQHLLSLFHLMSVLYLNISFNCLFHILVHMYVFLLSSCHQVKHNVQF